MPIRMITTGESHGPCLTAVLEGIPAGLPLNADLINLDLKRRQGRIQQELKDKIFEEAYALVNDYMKTAEYDDFLLRCIHNAIVFANGEEMTIYLNPSDEEKRSSLEDATGIHLTISAEDFTGGIRAVIRSRNILIDHSFKTALRNEYDKFLFSGGDSIV